MGQNFLLVQSWIIVHCVYRSHLFHYLTYFHIWYVIIPVDLLAGLSFSFEFSSHLVKNQVIIHEKLSLLFPSVDPCHHVLMADLPPEEGTLAFSNSRQNIMIWLCVEKGPRFCVFAHWSMKARKLYGLRPPGTRRFSWEEFWSQTWPSTWFCFLVVFLISTATTLLRWYFSLAAVFHAGD